VIGRNSYTRQLSRKRESSTGLLVISRGSSLKTQRLALAVICESGLGTRIALLEASRRCLMSATIDAEFLRLLKKDVDYFQRAVDHFEKLIPRVCSPLQDQWRLQAQSRKNFSLDLEILMEKAENCVQLSMQNMPGKSGEESASF
jgi:hypothetical protein